MDVDLESPKGFPVEYQPQIEAVLAKAEHAFLTATKDVPRKEIRQWWNPGLDYVQEVFLGVAKIYYERAMFEEWLTGVSKAVFSRLPKHPDPDVVYQSYWSREEFVEIAERKLKYSEGWMEHLQKFEEDWKALDCKDRNKRHAAVRYLELKVLSETGQRLSTAEICRQSGYKSTMFSNWICCRQPPSKKAHKIFVKALTAKWERGTYKRKYYGYGFKLTPRVGNSWHDVDCKDRRKREEAVLELRRRATRGTRQLVSLAEISRQAGYKRRIFDDWMRCKQPPRIEAHNLFVKVLTAQWERGTEKRKYYGYGFKLTPKVK
jgi:hypothetical protein